MAKKTVVTKRGSRVYHEKLTTFISQCLSSRCLDDDEDVEEVVASLIRNFRIYDKDIVRVDLQ